MQIMPCRFNIQDGGIPIRSHRVGRLRMYTCPEKRQGFLTFEKVNQKCRNGGRVKWEKRPSDPIRGARDRRGQYVAWQTGDVGPDESGNILSNDSCRMNHTLQSNGSDHSIWRWFLSRLPRCPAFHCSGLGNVFIPTPVLGNPPLSDVRRLFNPLNGFFAMLLCHLFK